MLQFVTLVSRVTFVDRLVERAERAMLHVTVVTVNLQLYIAELMGLYGKSDILVTGEKRRMMSMGFCFLC
jgi:hypothetical protein